LLENYLDLKEKYIHYRNTEQACVGNLVNMQILHLPMVRNLMVQEAQDLKSVL